MQTSNFRWVQYVEILGTFQFKFKAIFAKNSLNFDW